MKSKLATVTALIIGLSAVTVGMFPTPRSAVVSVLRGERRIRDLTFWRQTSDGAAESKDEGSTPIGGNRPEGLAASESAAEKASQPAVADRGADELLTKSIAMLDRCATIVAKTHQTIEIYGKHLIGSGEYLEQRASPSPRFRLELKVQVGNDPKTLLQVSDGRHFWRCETYKGKGTAERIDLARVVQAREGREDSRSAAMNQWPSVGGLPRLLRELRSAFLFSAAYSTTLRDKDRTPVVAVEGSWSPERLAAMMPDARGLPKSARKSGPRELPEHLPGCVVLYLGRDDLFPFRIEYRRRPTRTPPTPGAESDVPMVTMDFFEVALNVTIQPSRFAFAPGSLDWSDQTDPYLEKLGIKK